MISPQFEKKAIFEEFTLLTEYRWRYLPLAEVKMTDPMVILNCSFGDSRNNSKKRGFGGIYFHLHGMQFHSNGQLV
jgi:hypothetical protein